MKKLTMSLVAVAMLVAATASASPRRRHVHYPPPGPPPPTPATWYLGLAVVGTDVVGQTGGPEWLEPGGGLTAWIGLHVNSALSLELGWLGSLHNPAELGTWYGSETDFLVLEGVTADARLHLGGSGRGFDPYLQGGVGLYWLGSESLGLDSVGQGFQLGGGFDVWIGRALTVGLRARYHAVSMGAPEGGEHDTFVNAVTFEGSVGLHF